MARLIESPELLQRIRRKAYENAIHFGTYGKPANFEAGPVIANLQEKSEGQALQARSAG